MSRWFFVLCGMVILLSGCSRSGKSPLQQWLLEEERLRVLCTTQMIEDTVREVGGQRVATLALIAGQLDPHTYELVKGDDEKFAAADLIVYNGLGLEHGPSLHHHLEDNPKALSLGQTLLAHYPEAILRVNGQIDPHIWLDIGLWAKTVVPIVARLAQIDPDHAAEYSKRGAQLVNKMMQKDASVRAVLERVPASKRYLVTSHDAFNYFTRAYLATAQERVSGGWQERFKAPEGLAPEGQLNVSDIKMIVEHLLRYKIEVIFPESNVSRGSIDKIVSVAGQEGLRVRIASQALYGDAMGPPGTLGANYLGMIEWDGEVIAYQLNGGGGCE